MKQDFSYGESSADYMRRAAGFFSNIRLSIRTKMLLAFFVVIFMMGSVNAMFIVLALQYNRQYNALITSITTANNLMEYIKPAIDSEMWAIVAGKVEFDAGEQYQILGGVNTKIRQMMESTDSEKCRIKLDVILRTMETLGRYVDLMGEQIEQKMTYEDNIKVLDNIRGVSDLVDDLFQEYMIFEINRTEQKYMETQKIFAKWMVTNAVVMCCVIVFSVLAAWLISESIYLPIKKLHDVTATIAEKDLEVLITSDNADEIAGLGMSFNIMIGKIRELLDYKIKEQERLKKSEFKALQAQINPHFLYNTLDTIIWKAEANQKDQVIEIVQALSRFFRITLSRGKDWISIREELEHVKSYLTIQSMRYRDILDYHIEVDADILDATILKLTLQPLVENALYHGIKNKRSGGTITVRGGRIENNRVWFEVRDGGIGIKPEKLAQIRAEIEDVTGTSMSETSEGGFGLYNVNERIKLYYGKQYGLSIESEYQKGTRVSLEIPLQG